MIKLVVFDWNGVLIADTQATVDIDNHILKSTGRKPLTVAQYRETFTMPVKDFFVALGFSKEEIEREAKNVQKLFHSVYEPRVAKVRTRSGARELLDFIEGRGIEAMILSNHTKEGLEMQLERLRFKKYFSRVITNDMHATMARKNKADKLVDLVKRSPYKKSEILIIGDSPEETEAGKRAGITSVAITGGYYSERRLRAAEPDYLIHSLSEMIGIIKKL
ncbi:MAG: HAD family hydrolase [Patescibacteria group bacterium]|nr:HAD family hydrolase [Patescibacteria group bacterium]